jgi:HlyD family secretion protein
MDRPIEAAVRRKRIARRVGAAVLGTAAAVALIAALSSLIRPSIGRDRILTAKVDAGPIEATISASGTVVPEIEQVVSSPVDARLLRVLKRPGSSVAKGDPIVDLDLSAPVLALDRLRHDVALKETQQARARLDLEGTLSAVEGQAEIKRLELQNARTLLGRNRGLFEEGLVSLDQIRQSELDEARAAVELRQLESAAGLARRSNETQLRALALERVALGAEIREAARQIELGTTRSDRDGVVTWTVAEEGAAVRKGDPLARIADLTAFRVDATISDIHAGRLAVGMPARIDVGGARLSGTVSRIEPTIQNGVLAFSVRLEEPSNAALRSNLRVDVQLVTGGKERTLRLPRGQNTRTQASGEVFVVRGRSAVRTPVQFGASSFDHCEVLAGLNEGDEVIVSDTRAIQHLAEVRIR